VSVAHEDSASALKIVQAIKTARAARTMALDPAMHTIYLAATDYPPQAAGLKDRPKAVVGTFRCADVSDEVRGAARTFGRQTLTTRAARF
jgi:hypothetical protein